MANLTVKQAFTKAFQMLRSNVITHITLADSTSLTPTDGLLNIPAATDANPGVMTVEQVTALTTAQSDATKALGRLKTVHLSGKTNIYGVINMPDKTVYPLVALSRNFMISGNQSSVRVVNIQTTSVALATNTDVDFDVLGMKVTP